MKKNNHLKVVNKPTRKRSPKVKPLLYEIKKQELSPTDLAKATGQSGAFFRDLVNLPYRGYAIPPYQKKGTYIKYDASDVEIYLREYWGIEVINPFTKKSGKIEETKIDEKLEAAITSWTTRVTNEDVIDEDDVIINRVERIMGSRLLKPTDSDETCRLINHQSSNGDDYFIAIPLLKEAAKCKNDYPTTIELEDKDNKIVSRKDIKKFLSILKSINAEVRDGKQGQGEYLIVDEQWNFK